MDENELKVISEIAKNSQASQRHLSKTLDLSLGMVNIILHRMIEKGYMKIKQLDGRKVQYILTPKGFSEKVERSKQYVKRTIGSISVMKDAIRSAIDYEYDKGIRKFYVAGTGELSHIIDIAAREAGHNDISILHTHEIKGTGNAVLFWDNESFSSKENGNKYIDLGRLLAEVL